MKWAFTLLSLSLATLSYAKLTIGTYNIRNFDYDERERIHTDKPALENILKGLKFDLLGVNEIGNVPEFNNFIGGRMPGYDVSLSKCGGAHGQHLGFVYNKTKLKLLKLTEEMAFSGEGSSGGCFTGSRPAVVGLFEEIATKQQFYAVQHHLKSGSNAGDLQNRARQFRLMQDLAKRLTASVPSLVMMGDLNTTGYRDRTGDYKNFTALLTAAGLTNLSAKIGCSAYWWGGTEDGIESPSHLDHVLMTGAMLQNKASQSVVGGHCKAVSCREASPAELGVSYTGVSDHCPQTATIR